MRTLRSADLITGACISLVGLLALVSSLSIKPMAGESLDPRTIPFIVGWGMVLVGAGIAHMAWRYRGPSVPVRWPDWAGQRRLAVTAAALLAYVGLIEPAGFPVATALFIAGLCRYLGRYRLWLTTLGGIATGVVVYYVFMEFLGLTFPLGLLEYLGE
jgi:hypothetical protein